MGENIEATKWDKAANKESGRRDARAFARAENAATIVDLVPDRQRRKLVGCGNTRKVDGETTEETG